MNVHHFALRHSRAVFPITCQQLHRGDANVCGQPNVLQIRLNVSQSGDRSQAPVRGLLRPGGV